MDTIEKRLAPFGYKRGAHFPKEGRQSRMVDGVAVWIEPEPEGGNRRKRHRMKAQCPSCGLQLSAGRLEQHRYTAACLKRANRKR